MKQKKKLKIPIKWKLALWENKIDKPLARLEIKLDRIQINKIRKRRNHKWRCRSKDHKRSLYANEMDNLEEMKQEVLENINRPITSNETETVIKNLPAEVQDLMAWQANSSKHLC